MVCPSSWRWHRTAWPTSPLLIELERFASTLLDRGWEGVVSVEVLGEELRALPIDELASRAFRTTESFWR